MLLDHFGDEINLYLSVAFTVLGFFPFGGYHITVDERTTVGASLRPTDV